MSTDPRTLRALLARDLAWGAYLLADLEPPYAAHATWFVDEPSGAVVLLYREFPLPVLAALGPADACASLWERALGQVGPAPRIFVACLPGHRPFVDRLSPFLRVRAMIRMRLPPDVALPDPGEPGARLAPYCRRLGPGDLAAARALFADGALPDEEPEFFAAAMLEQGGYHGVWEGARLLAIAGTHVLAKESSVAAIGNVFTDRAARGRGLAQVTTAAVARALRTAGISTIVLNVHQDNAAALRVYARLGFVVHGEFDEGWAVPRI